MSWAPGDIALCVKGGFIGGDPTLIHPVSGRLYTVERAGMAFFVNGTHLALWLQDGPANGNGEPVWVAHRFVKVTPPEADAFDQEIIDLMTGKPVPVEA